MSNPRIKEKYLNEVVPALMEKFQYNSIMQVPKIAKVAINKAIVIKPVPMSNKGFLPNLSINQIAMIVNMRFVKPTTIACKNEESVLPPACSKIVGA